MHHRKRHKRAVQCCENNRLTNKKIKTQFQRSAVQYKANMVKKLKKTSLEREKVELKATNLSDKFKVKAKLTGVKLTG